MKSQNHPSKDPSGRRQSTILQNSFRNVSVLAFCERLSPVIFGVRVFRTTFPDGRPLMSGTSGSMLSGLKYSIKKSHQQHNLQRCRNLMDLDSFLKNDNM